MSMPRRTAALRLHKALDRLAAMLGDANDMPIDPDAIEVDLDDETPGFNAFVSIDPARDDGARIEISLDVVRQLDALFANLEGEPLTAATALVELALQWIILHEVAHWALGHLGYARAHFGLTGRAVRLAAIDHRFEADDHVAASADDSALYRCLELQADFLATEILDVLHEGGSQHSCVSETATAVADTEGTLPRSRRLVGIAAGAVILLMERLRRDAGIASSPRHPSPEARAFNVMQVILGHNLLAHGFERDGEIVLRGGTDDHIERIRDSLKPTLLIFSLDLTGVADSLQVDRLFARSELAPLDFGEGSGDLVSATIRDLYQHTLNPNAAPDAYTTSGVKEFASLKPRSQDLLLATARYGVWHGRP